MITKEETMRLKGVAILMMLFLHLFNTLERTELCTTFLNFWNGKPLVYAVSRAMGFCVPIYIFLSGYGLTVTYDRKEGHQLHTAKRLLSLYANFWTVCLLFIPLACYLQPQQYPGTALTLIGNLTGIHCTYNLEWWFLFPYVLLALCAPDLIGYISQLSGKKTFKVLVGVCLLSFAIQLLRKVVPNFTGRQLIIWYFTLLFPFMTGIAFARFKVFGQCRTYFSHRMKPQRKNLYLSLLILVVCLLRMTIGPSMYNPLFATLFLVLFVSTNRPKGLNLSLQFLGKHSTNMWLTHTFFSWYLFADFFYGLQYPLLMYVVLIAVSLCTSYFIQLLNRPLQERIKRLPFYA